jgi:hypothetical protein
MKKIKEVKLPWFKFFPSDWKSDASLSRCSPTTRGVWIDLICDMHNSLRSGKLSGSLMELSRAARCTTDEMSLALDELSATKTADVTLHHDYVTLINRRMYRESKIREQNRMRQNKKRCHAAVTRLSAGEVRCQRSDTPIVPLKGDTRTRPKNENGNNLPVSSLWLILWESYPAHRRGNQRPIPTEFLTLNPDKLLLNQILAGMDRQKESDSWKEKDGKYVPGIKNWLSRREWESVSIATTCGLCNQIGVVVRNGDEKPLPWSLDCEVNQGLKPELCPECKGKNRNLCTPGLDFKF